MGTSKLEVNQIAQKTVAALVRTGWGLMSSASLVPLVLSGVPVLALDAVSMSGGDQSRWLLLYWLAGASIGAALGVGLLRSRLV